MDKNKIINYLNNKFLKEEATPGIDLTNQVKKESDKINKEALKTIEKDVASYDKEIKKNVGKAKMPANKFNYNGDKEKEYHDEMEIMNGQEMIQYDREPNQDFKDRAKEAIVGSSRMGNKAGEGTANVEPTWGASSADFGKNLVKRAGDSAKKRQDAEYKIISFGDDIETVPKGSKPMAKHSAFVKEGLEQDSKNIAGNKPYGTKDQHDFENSEEARKPLDGTEDEKDEKDEEENKNNTKPQIKEGMKRLNFKKEFNGVGNALKMIPESYRVDNKVFEMTDGNESYKIRWEGTLTEGKAVVLTASNKTMVNEDMQKMKHLMGYKSQDTLGTVKGKARINENAVFGDIFNKTKALLEGEDIEDQNAPEKDADKVISQAKEAKKDVEGSVSTEKGTQAPAPKTGSMESLDDAKSQAKEAKEHVEGSVESKLGLGLGVKTKEGHWDAISVPQAADAKKHVTMNEGVTLGESYFAPMDENMYEEMMGDGNTAAAKKKDEYGNYRVSDEDLKNQPLYTEEEHDKTMDEILADIVSAMDTEDDVESKRIMMGVYNDLKTKVKTNVKSGMQKTGDYLRKKLGEPMEEGLYETEGYDNDNADADAEFGSDIQNYLIGAEDEYGPLTTAQIIQSALELYQKADIHAAKLARVVDFILKSRY